MPTAFTARLRRSSGGGLLLVAIAVASLLAPERIPGLAALDRLLFPLTLHTLAPSKPTDTVAVLRLPAYPASSVTEQLRAMSDLADALPTAQPAIWWLPNDALERALPWTLPGQRLQALLGRANIVSGGRPLPTDDATLLARLARKTALLAEPPAADQPSPPTAAEPGLPLLARTATGVASTPLLEALQLADAVAPVRSTAHGLYAADGGRLAGPDGRVYPHWTTSARPLRELRPSDLAAATPAVVVVGAVDDPELAAAAHALTALLQSSYSNDPWWSLPLDKALVIALLLYYLMLLPRLSAGSGFLLSLLLAIGLVGLQFGLQLADHQWLALTGSSGMLLIGYPVAALRSYSLRQRRQLQRAGDSARLQLAAYQIREGELDQAREQLLATANSRKRLERLYDLAIAYERRRQYSYARDIFAACYRQDKTFRDVDQRLAVLAEISMPTATAGSALSGADTLLMPQVVAKPELGRYRLERELGRGAMGVVYLGLDPKIGRTVAIKTLDMGQLPRDEVQEFKTRFFREAEAAGRLSHPNIVTVYDVGEEGDLAFIAMDYANGKPLSEFTQPERLLPVATVYALLADVADALDYAHANGVIHRDIKPANLIYDAEAETVKITDFGIARVADTSRTSTGTVWGSPSYMAPEQFAGSKVEGTADIFSLGVSCYQLLSGALPFAADNIAQLAYQISQGRYQDVRSARPDLPASANRIVAKALAKTAAERYQTGRALATALRNAATKEEVV